MSQRSSSVFLAASLALALAPSAAAQTLPREGRTFVVPPPSVESTGGEPVTPVAPLHSAPRLRGFKLETRDALHPEEITLVGLEQSERPYRPDLALKRTALGEGVTRTPESEAGELDSNALYQRQLAIFSGETVEAPDDVERGTPTATPIDREAVPEPALTDRMSWWGGGLLALAIVGLVVWRRRAAKRR
jgi:hypothetical protein